MEKGKPAMVNLTKIDAIRNEAKNLNDQYSEIHALMFTNDRNLSDAGRGLISELKRRGLRQKDAVRILGISATAAHNNW
ncbi:hypothetical protein [Methylobacterium sp. E-046]|uniref:hypothetical protein n=1 Tax=Methylobacterium sp. E-046 TaxID=2836576 RepID=UPI001FBA15B6|nr:hypothetical protein [Methylobacterium sp. E-046]MCJ2097488.1 hypothetical protein [Methylobacterium sp. E-046]